MVHLADVVLAGVLGAAILAIVLMSRCTARNTRLINELRAELTAQKILTLTANAHLPAAAGAEAEAADPVPVRARGHLALLAGTDEGGTAPSARFRGAWNTRCRTLTVTVTAATVLIGGGAAVVFTVPGLGPGRGAPPAVAPGIPGKKEQQPTPTDDCDNEIPRAAGGPDPDPEPNDSSEPLPLPAVWLNESRTPRTTRPTKAGSGSLAALSLAS